jgi:hypothetical protein
MDITKPNPNSRLFGMRNDSMRTAHNVLSTIRLTKRGTSLLVLLLFAWLFGNATAVGSDAASPQVWLVSTRGIPHDCIAETSADSYRYLRWTECGWEESDAAAFHATDDPATPTTIFIHGNATSVKDAFAKGFFTYQTIHCQSPDKPMRFVIWSWPAGRILRHLYDDVCLKVDYSNVEGVYLARWLAELKPGVKVSLIGHSLGARIVTGSLHLLGGGELVGQHLSQETIAAWTKGPRHTVRTALLAAAIDADWLAPGGCHEKAMSQIEQALITTNGCDRVLRLYPLIYARRCVPQAMGFVGPDGLDEKANVEVIDVASTVGKVHCWRHYCSAPDVYDSLRRFAFLDDTPSLASSP